MWKHLLQHLPSIAAQPDIDPSIDSGASNDGSEAAVQVGFSDKAFFQWNWVWNDVRRQESNPST
jgi:hypothetical protein